MKNAWILFLVWIAVGVPSMARGDQEIKKPNVSGQFYTADPGRLSSEIDDYIRRAGVHPLAKRVEIVIVPHAGYMYSGWVAAYGFKAAAGNPYQTIVILAPSHYSGFDGIAVWGGEGGFQTPLGVASVDHEFAKKLMAEDEKFYFARQAFEQEHSLEVEIPFLQKVFKDFKIVPVIMGQPSYQMLERFAASLNKIIGDRRDVLIVVSTDLSHYHNDAKAREMDRLTINTVKELNAEGIWRGCQLRTSMEMCGFVPVTAALLYARERGLKGVEMLRYANSGDVTGDKDKVVGYTSIVIYDGEASSSPSEDKTAVDEKSVAGIVEGLTVPQKKRLLEIARKTIEGYVRDGKIPQFEETDPRLMKEEGAFVTVHKAGHLRGCIGNILGRGPLYVTVRDMAISSATKDPRFSPITAKDLEEIDVEISVLSKPRVIQNTDEIVLGRHGVIVSQGPFRQGVFLPQVAVETGWTKEEFLSQLCAQKAGLAPDAWKDPKTKIEIFTAEVFSEKELEK